MSKFKVGASIFSRKWFSGETFLDLLQPKKSTKFWSAVPSRVRKNPGF